MNAQTEVKAAHKNVHVALAAAQGEMDAVRKGSVNPAFKSRYADLSDVMQAVMPALNRHGLALYHAMDLTRDQPAMVTFLAHGESETQIECAVPLIVNKNDMQGMKSAITYAKRIGAESVTGTAPEDDDGNAAAAAPPPRQQARSAPPAPDPLEDMEAFTSKVNAAVFALGKAQSVDGIKGLWATLDAAVKADARVIAAGTARKAELQAPAAVPIVAVLVEKDA
jgi:hypothetical protein